MLALKGFCSIKTLLQKLMIYYYQDKEYIKGIVI